MKIFYKLLLSAIVFAVFQGNAQIPAFNVTVNTPASAGYYYFCPYKLSAFAANFPPGTQTQMVLDHNGHVVYYRPVAGVFAGDFKQQPNGLISYVYGNKFYLMDSTFTIVDSVTTRPGIVFDLHDLQILPNGHFLLLGDEDVHRDLSSYHMFYNNGSPGSANAVVTAGVVEELDSAKNVVFEWHSIDHFNFNEVDSFFLLDSTRVDWTHMNAVELDNDGNILVSSRHFDEITKINRSDSSVIWRMGGKANQFTFINDSIKFIAQHDIRRLPNGDITLFDNGRQSPLHPTSGKEYQLDEVNHIATLVWSHGEGASVFSRSQGDTQRRPNGNTLVSYGNIINENIVFNVVDTSDNKVFEISFPDSQLTYRSFNYDTLSWLYEQPNITCYSDSTNNYLVADSGYSSYRWSNGDTTQSTIAIPGDTFFVYVPLGDSGFISSPLFVAGIPTDPVTASVSNCGQGSVTLTATCPDPVSWYTSPGGVLVGTGLTYVTPVLTSTQNYIAVSHNGDCPSQAVEADAIILPLPSVNLGPDTLVGNPYPLDAGAGFTSYVWSNGDSTQTITVSASDTICVTVTDTNGCAGSDCVIVDISTGISDVKGNNLFTVYPNPSDGRITVEFTSAFNKAQIEIRNITGQVIKKINADNSSTVDIDLTSIQSGVYFIKLISDGKTEIQKINIQ